MYILTNNNIHSECDRVIIVSIETERGNVDQQEMFADIGRDPSHSFHIDDDRPYVV